MCMCVLGRSCHYTHYNENCLCTYVPQEEHEAHVTMRVTSTHVHVYVQYVLPLYMYTIAICWKQHVRSVHTSNQFLYYCIQFMHVFCVGTSNKIVAVHSQDSVLTCTVLAVGCNYHVHVRTYVYDGVCVHMVQGWSPGCETAWSS